MNIAILTRQIESKSITQSRSKSTPRSRSWARSGPNYQSWYKTYNLYKCWSESRFSSKAGFMYWSMSGCKYERLSGSYVRSKTGRV